MITLKTICDELQPLAERLVEEEAHNAEAELAKTLIFMIMAMGTQMNPSKRQDFCYHMGFAIAMSGVFGMVIEGE